MTYRQKLRADLRRALMDNRPENFDQITDAIAELVSTLARVTLAAVHLPDGTTPTDSSVALMSRTILESVRSVEGSDL